MRLELPDLTEQGQRDDDRGGLAAAVIGGRSWPSLGHSSSYRRRSIRACHGVLACAEVHVDHAPTEWLRIARDSRPPETGGMALRGVEAWDTVATTVAQGNETDLGERPDGPKPNRQSPLAGAELPPARGALPFSCIKGKD